MGDYWVLEKLALDGGHLSLPVYSAISRKGAPFSAHLDQMEQTTKFHDEVSARHYATMLNNRLGHRLWEPTLFKELDVSPVTDEPPTIPGADASVPSKVVTGASSGQDNSLVPYMPTLVA